MAEKVNPSAVGAVLVWFYHEWMVDQGVSVVAARDIDPIHFSNWLGSMLGSRYYAASLADVKELEGIYEQAVWDVLENASGQGSLHQLVCNFWKMIVFSTYPPLPVPVKRIISVLALEGADGRIAFLARVGIPKFALTAEADVQQSAMQNCAHMLEGLTQATARVAMEHASAPDALQFVTKCQHCQNTVSVPVAENAVAIFGQLHHQLGGAAEPTEQQPPPKGGFLA